MPALDGPPVYRRTVQKELLHRATLLRDRGMNLFQAVDGLARAVPVDDPRFDRLKDELESVFSLLDSIFGHEDKIDDLITGYEGEVGK